MLRSSQDDIMETAPRRFVKPLAPPVVAQRSEMEGLSQIKDFEVRLCSGGGNLLEADRCPW